MYPSGAVCYNESLIADHFLVCQVTWALAATRRIASSSSLLSQVAISNDGYQASNHRFITWLSPTTKAGQ